MLARKISQANPGRAARGNRRTWCEHATGTPLDGSGGGHAGVSRPFFYRTQLMNDEGGERLCPNAECAMHQQARRTAARYCSACGGETKPAGPSPDAPRAIVAAHPPMAPTGYVAARPPSTWPNAIGIVSIVLGSLGCLSGLWVAISPWFMGLIMDMIPDDNATAALDSEAPSDVSPGAASEQLPPGAKRNPSAHEHSPVVRLQDPWEASVQLSGHSHWAQSPFGPPENGGVHLHSPEASQRPRSTPSWVQLLGQGQSP